MSNNKELEKGVISEEALEEIAGGIGVNKESLKKYAKKAGIMILGAGAIAAGAGAAGYYGSKHGWLGKQEEIESDTMRESVHSSEENESGSNYAITIRRDN